MFVSTLGCGCGGACNKRSLGFLAYLGATATPAPANPTSAILQQICPSGVGKGTCATSNVSTYTGFLTSAIQSRFLPPYTTATGLSNANACAGYTPASGAQTALTIAKTGTGIGVSVAGSLTSAGLIAGTSAIPVIGTIVALATGIISMIVGHHSTAVKEQDQLLCQAVPGVNNLLAQIDAALAGGTITPTQAEAQYSSFLSQFASEMKSDPSYKSGDAMNGYLVALQGVIAARNQDLQNGVLTGGAPGPWTVTASPMSVGGTVAQLESDLGITGSSANWLPYALAGGLALLFLL